MMVCVWTLFYFIVMVTECVESLIISAKLNSTALLPCYVTPVYNQTPHVQWSIGSETMFERLGKDVYQGEGYEDRVDVPEDELLKGNCSLVLKNVKDTDANIYKSFMMVKRTKRSVTVKWDLVQNITLTIDVDPDPTREKPGVRADAAQMMCPNSLIICILSLLLFIFSEES